jgi:hypothetical protein
MAPTPSQSSILQALIVRETNTSHLSSQHVAAHAKNYQNCQFRHKESRGARS